MRIRGPDLFPEDSQTQFFRVARGMFPAAARVLTGQMGIRREKDARQGAVQLFVLSKISFIPPMEPSIAVASYGR